MALLGNILWFIFGGWWNFLLYGFLGCVCCVTIIGIPIGKALFQYAKLMLFPYGKVIVRETDIKGKENVAAIRRAGGLIANILWLPVGVISFILNIGLMIACAITIIGIPFAVVIAKSCTFLLWPIGARVITKQEAETLRMEKSMMKVMGTAMAVGAMTTQSASPVSENRQVIESKLTDSIQTDKIVEWAKPYLEYIVAVVGMIIILISLLFQTPVGFIIAAPVMVMSAVFGIMKQNHIAVYAVLGIEILINLALCTLRHFANIRLAMSSFVFISLLQVVCYIGILAWYTIVYVDKTGNIREKLFQRTAILQDKIGKSIKRVTSETPSKSPKPTISKEKVNTAAAGNRFCRNCGTACTSQAKFCPKCGSAIGK